MRILIADDDRASRTLLARMLELWEHEVVEAADGDRAWELIDRPDSPRMLLLDRMMPGIDGLELCRRARELDSSNPRYIVLVTAMGLESDIVAGLEAGADDYITKPFHAEKLHARLAVGLRILELQQRLSRRIDELTKALEQIKILHGIIPICMHCHKVRRDDDSWQQLEHYIHEHSQASFSHGVCLDCRAAHYPDDATD